MKKAFDSVSHKILMSKLHKLRFRGNVHSFLKSYLSNRYQYVHINNYNSTLKNIKFGVPQGSVLGPILFLLYINDIIKLQFDFVSLFADDTVLGLKG